MKKDIDIPAIYDDYDWKEVFGEGEGGNCDKSKVDAIPDDAAIDLTPPMLADVVEVVCAANGENDGAAWIGVFKLRDGRYVVAEGSCDYTGWDCQAGNSLQVAGSLDDAIQYGLQREDRIRLDAPLLPPGFPPDFDLTDETNRRVAADRFEELGQPELAAELRS